MPRAKNTPAKPISGKKAVAPQRPSEACQSVPAKGGVSEALKAPGTAPSPSAAPTIDDPAKDDLRRRIEESVARSVAQAPPAPSANRLISADGFPPTAEQEVLLDLAQQGHKALVVVAGAGTG